MLEKLKAHALTLRPTFIGACNIGDLEEVKRYIEEGEDIHANDNEAIKAAIQKEHLDVINIFLREGVHWDVVPDDIIYKLSHDYY